MSWVKHTDARANPHRTIVGKEALWLGHGVLKRVRVRNSDEFAQLQGEMEALAGRGFIEISAEELAELVQAIEDGMAVEAEGGGGLFDGTSLQVGVKGFQQLLAVA